ncbi:MAG: VOC family protein, partial [Terriglobales bacterium]
MHDGFQSSFNLERISDCKRWLALRLGRTTRRSDEVRHCAYHFLESKVKLRYNPPMQGIPWSTIALGSLLLIAARSTGGQEVKSPEPEKAKPAVKTEQRGRILGIGGVFFKSADRDQMREWYSKHLGLADKGQGVMLPWREHDDPQKEHVTVWTVFPASTKYFDPSPAPFMINYIVDDMDALLDRLKQEGVKIDAKRMDESYGRFAWIYDLDGNKIELWQP